MKTAKFRISVFSLLCLIVTVLYAQDLVDTHTPENFLFDRKARIVAEYIDTVLKRGDAATLIPAIRSIHANLKGGGYNAEQLEAMEPNTAVLIAIAEGLIEGQEYADKMPLTPEEVAVQNTDVENAWQAQLAESGLDSADGIQTVTETYVPPEHDKIYNEKKKDLLEEAHEMLETIRKRR